MEIKLSCPCCGETDFLFPKDIEIKKILLDEFYLYKENQLNDMVVCKKCKLDDYVANLEFKIIE